MHTQEDMDEMEAAGQHFCLPVHMGAVWKSASLVLLLKHDMRIICTSDIPEHRPAEWFADGNRLPSIGYVIISIHHLMDYDNDYQLRKTLCDVLT